MVERMTQEKMDGIVEYCQEHFGETVNRQQLVQAAEFVGCTFSQTKFMRNESTRVRRGIFRVPKNAKKPEKKEKVSTPEKSEETTKDSSLASSEMESYVPKKMKGYVKFGHYERLKKLIASGEFFPAFITGLSGNGKTQMVQQICAELDRECIRVNFTEQTDEDDLLGGFRLLNNETVFSFGSVAEAMMRGAILLLDEVDLGSYKIMCLQPVLEGSGVYLKKINKYVDPAPGFNVIATANTKGRGSHDGKYAGTNYMNEAFLERFANFYEQEYPNKTIETKILNLIINFKGDVEKKFVKDLTTWASNIRKTYYAGVDTIEIITTRRLIDIVRDYNIFGDKIEAVKMCLARFDEENKAELMKNYLAISGDDIEEVFSDSVKKKKEEKPPVQNMPKRGETKKNSPPAGTVLTRPALAGLPGTATVPVPTGSQGMSAQQMDDNEIPF